MLNLESKDQTFFRRRVEYGLDAQDAATDISDEELLSVIREFRRDAPYSGVQMCCGSLRAKGIKVTRERVRTVLRLIDPLNSAQRWPLLITRRHPYSVPGPNSLWHIGMITNIVYMYPILFKTHSRTGSGHTILFVANT